MKKNNLEKKMYTKKELKAKNAAQRSIFSSGMNLGGRVMTTSKDYNRNRAKNDTRRILAEY